MRKRICVALALAMVLMSGCSKQGGSINTPSSGIGGKLEATTEKIEKLDGDGMVNTATIENTEETTEEVTTEEDKNALSSDAKRINCEVGFKSEEYYGELTNTYGHDMFVSSSDHVFILDTGYEKLKASIAEFNTENLDNSNQSYVSICEFIDGEEIDLESAYFPWYENQEISVVRSDSQVFSMTQAFTAYFGGAHPSTVRDGYSYDSVTGEKLTINDVVTDYDGFKAAVIDCLEENEDDYFPEWRETVDSYFDGTYELNWVVTGLGVKVWFNEYDIAPYASGEISVTINLGSNDGLYNMKYFNTNLVAETEDESRYGNVNKTLTDTAIENQTDFFVNVFLPSLEMIHEKNMNEYAEFLDGMKVDYEIEEPAYECTSGEIHMKDPSNGAEMNVYFWPIYEEESMDAADAYIYDVNYQYKNVSIGKRIIEYSQQERLEIIQFDLYSGTQFGDIDMMKNVFWSLVTE